MSLHRRFVFLVNPLALWCWACRKLLGCAGEGRYLISCLSFRTSYSLCACLLTAFRGGLCGCGSVFLCVLQLCGLFCAMLAAWTLTGQLLFPFKRRNSGVAPGVFPVGSGALSTSRPDPPRRLGRSVGQQWCSCCSDDRVAGRTAATSRSWLSPESTARRAANVVYPDDSGGLPPCRKCGEPTILRRVRKTTINHGRPFWTCPSCDAFSWADCPLCFCGYGAISQRRKVSDGKRNEGKFFFGCANEDFESQCEFFAWEDDLPTFEERKSSTTPDENADIKAALRPGMLHTMPPKFLHALRFAVSHNGRLRLSGDMEVRQRILLALAVALQFQSKWPLLIVCPSHWRPTWCGEARQWLNPITSVCSVSCEGDVQALEDVSSSCVVVTSYHMLLSISDEWLDEAGVVLVDECHSLRGEDTARYHEVKKLLRCDHFIFLSSFSSKTAEQLCPQLPLWKLPSDSHDD